MSGDDHSVDAHRLGALEAKVDELLTLTRQWVEVQADMRYMRRDLDEFKRMQNLHTESIAEHNAFHGRIVTLDDQMSAFSHPDTGLLVRFGRLENEAAHQGATIKAIMRVGVAGVVALLGLFVAAVWDLIVSK